MRYAVRVHGRGVVTQFNGEPITERETAEAIVRSIDLMYGERCTIEMLVLDLPVSPRAARVPTDGWIECPRCERQRHDVGACNLCGNLGMLDENAERLHCDCRADDWVEGDNSAIRCEQCGGYAGEPGTSIRLVASRAENGHARSDG